MVQIVAWNSVSLYTLIFATITINVISHRFKE